MCDNADESIGATIPLLIRRNDESDNNSEVSESWGTQFESDNDVSVDGDESSTKFSIDWGNCITANNYETWEDESIESVEEQIIQMPSDYKMLSTLEVWSADTGAIVHNTPHMQGLVVSSEAKNGDGVTVGNGQKMKSTAIGCMQGIITDKCSKENTNVTLNDVVHAPEAQFNLLSVTKLMSEGWNIQGSKNKLMVKKRQATINFDIIVKTRRGKLFYVNIQRAGELSCATIEISKDRSHRAL